MVIAVLQPAFDVAFCVGIVEGLRALRHESQDGKIW